MKTVSSATGQKISSKISRFYPVTPNVFVTHSFDIIDMDWTDPCRYDYTSILDDPDFDPSQYDYTPSEEYPEFRDWAECHLSYEELFEVPIMNYVRYFPSFVTFEEEDRYKSAGSTTLLYDNELERWGVALTGGGMNLAPHLIDTFIQLEKGVPLELARSMDRNYSAYVNAEKHLVNCHLVSVALKDLADALKLSAHRLAEN